MPNQTTPPYSPPKDLGFPWENFDPWQVAGITAIAILVGILSLLSAHYAGWEWLFFGLIFLLLCIFAFSLVKPLTSLYIAILFIGIEHLGIYPVVVSKDVPFFFVLTTLFQYMVIPGWFLNKYSKTVHPRKSSPLDLPFFFLVILGGISIFWAQNCLYAFYWWILLFNGFLLYYFVGALVIDEKILRRIIISFIMGVMIIAMGCVITGLKSYNYEYVKTYGVWRFYFYFKGTHRAGGLAGTNHAAFTLNMALSYIVTNLLRAKTKEWKFLNGLLAAYILFAEILTQSRTGTICAMIIMILLISLFVDWKHKIVRNVAFTLLIILALIVLGDLVHSGKSFFGRYSAVATSDSGKITGIGVRIKWWIAGWKFMVKNNYLLYGLGMGGLMWTVDLGPDINSVYFCYVFELGLIGFLLLIYTVVMFIHCLFPVLRYAVSHRSYVSDMFLASSVSFLGTVMIHGLLEYDFYGRLIWFNIALLLTTWHLTKEKMENSEALNRITSATVLV